MTQIGIANTQVKKKMREIKIFRNMTEVSNVNGKITMIHQDDMQVYNTWFLTTDHSIDEVIYRGDSDGLPDIYKPFLQKIDNPKKVLITSSSQDTY